MASVVGIFLIVIMLMVVTEKYKRTEKTGQQSTKEQNQTQQEEAINMPKEVGEKNDIPVDTWKLYTNSERGYSIKYPSEWVSSFADGTSFFVKELRKSGEDFPNFGNVLSDNHDNLINITGDYFINISVYKDIGDHVQDLKEWRKHDGNKYEEVLIKGYSALKFNKKPHKSGNKKDMAGSLSFYFIDKNNDGYGITIWYKDVSNSIGERMISTLTFIH